MHEIKLGPATVTWFGHASFMITDGMAKLYIDPFVLHSNPDKADVILVTHEHFDHCDVNNTSRLNTDETKVVGAKSAIAKLGFGVPIKVGDNANADGIMIHAVEAYNMNKFMSPGKPFHPRGLGVGFVVEMGGKKIYHAGDTDNIPEMVALQNMNIDVALLPIGGKYTMDAREAAEAAQAIMPKFIAPMHYNSDKYGVAGINADPIDLAKLLVGKGIVVNILTPMV